MRQIYQLIAAAGFALFFAQSASAQGYDPNQAQGIYGQQGGGYQAPVYQQYNGIPQTSPNYGYSGGGYQQPPQYAGQQQYAQPPQQGYGGAQQGQLQQQYAQYGQMPQAPVYYGQAQQSTQGQGGMPNNLPTDSTGAQMPAGSFLNDSSPPDSPGSSSPPDNTTTETPNGGGHGGAMIKGAAGLLGKFAGGVGKVAAPAASMYLMNKASGGRIRYVMPAPMMPMPGMSSGYGGGYGYNPYMGTGMRSMMGGW